MRQLPNGSAQMGKWVLPARGLSVSSCEDIPVMEELEWTTTKPTEDGYYWYHHEYDGRWNTEIILISDTNCVSFPVSSFWDMELGPGFVDELEGEFAGPIKSPPGRGKGAHSTSKRTWRERKINKLKRKGLLPPRQMPVDDDVPGK